MSNTGHDHPKPLIFSAQYNMRGPVVTQHKFAHINIILTFISNIHILCRISRSNDTHVFLIGLLFAKTRLWTRR